MKKYILILAVILIIIICIITGIIFFKKNNNDTNIMISGNTIMDKENNEIDGDNNQVEDFQMDEVLEEYSEQINKEQDAENDSDLDSKNQNDTVEPEKGYLFKYVDNPTDEEMIRKYLRNYSNLAFYDLEESFDLLDDNFKAKFDNFEQYKVYVQENAEILYNLYKEHFENIYMYRDDEQNINIYTFRDSEGRKYTIKEEAIMKYTINIEELEQQENSN